MLHCWTCQIDTDLPCRCCRARISRFATRAGQGWQGLTGRVLQHEKPGSMSCTWQASTRSISTIRLAEGSCTTLHHSLA